MNPKIILVVSVVYLALGMFSILAFVFLPSMLDGHDYWGRFVFGVLVMLLIWLSVKIIRGRRFHGTRVPLCLHRLLLLGLLAIPMYVMQSFRHVDSRETLSPWGCLFCVAYLFAFVILFAHRGVRGLFRRPRLAIKARRKQAAQKLQDDRVKLAWTMQRTAHEQGS